MTWGEVITGSIVLTVVGAGIIYLFVRLWSRAPWVTLRRNIVRGQSSSRDPIDDV